MKKLSPSWWLVVFCCLAFPIALSAETQSERRPSPKVVDLNGAVHLQSIKDGVVLTLDRDRDGVVEEIFYLQVEGPFPSIYYLGDARLAYWEDGVAVYLPDNRVFELAVLDKPRALRYTGRELHIVEGYGLSRQAGDFLGMALGEVPSNYLPSGNVSIPRKSVSTNTEVLNPDPGGDGVSGGCTTISCSKSCGGSSCSASCGTGQKASCACNNGFATCECIKC